MKKIIRTYSELIRFDTFEERYQYLKLGGAVGGITFGRDRMINQYLYNMDRWLALRDYVIVRDHGCDLAHLDYEIVGSIIVHHMNPITLADILEDSDFVWDPEFLVSTILQTHNAIHYATKDYAPLKLIERTKNDTCPWRR